MQSDLFDKTKYISLAMTIASKFKDETNMVYGFAMNGVDIGLQRIQRSKVMMEEVERKPDMIAAHLTWYVKTCIEVELGYDNEDTRAWKNGKFDEYAKKAARS